MSTTRRKFLQVLAAGGAAVTCAHTAACTLPNQGPVTADSLPEGLSFSPDGASLIIGKDAGGLYAMSSICTHAGCDMTSQGAISGGEVDCYCHGSAFDADGNAVGGPASRPLAHFKVAIASDGTFSVDTNAQVSPEERTPIPPQAPAA